VCFRIGGLRITMSERWAKAASSVVVPVFGIAKKTNYRFANTSTYTPLLFHIVL